MSEGDERRDHDPADQPPPDFAESLRDIGSTAKASLGAAADSARALRSLMAADLSLARVAMGRALAFAGVAVAFGASAWLFLMATLVALLRNMGLSWLMSMLIAAGISLVVTAYAGWRAMHYFDHTRLQATRRQLARLGIGELSDLMPTPDSPQSARETAKDLRENVDQMPKQQSNDIDITPP
ncbi:phage holin family protein [Lysobacter auxotrophicus]|uniref:Phage holin family protein n=1 Tax=Lysobacter auxotrophicus TaxID=2992573 RepID=A0ABM8D9R8_9GAMM|nr:phage holin family protein [Lysobacter auxotrophicus]BDU15302.1 phage holin family protein [Lysobacter auxotrophicus]